MVANKEYALAGKFFEVMIEPALSAGSSLFYAAGFHKFIATLLYVYSRSANPFVVDALKNFMEMMRSKNPDQLHSVLSPLSHFDQSEPVGMVFAFVLCHQDEIKRELETVRDSGSWPLELSMTALHCLLAHSAEEFKVLKVYCDESKPIREARDFLNVLIGREDKLYFPFGNQPSPSIVYNLAEPINLVDSRVSPGVQIADVLSSLPSLRLKEARRRDFQRVDGYPSPCACESNRA